MKLLTFAEIIWDVYPEADVIGGSGLNFCAHAVKCGMEGRMVSAVGTDEYGARALSVLRNLGIRTDLVATVPGETGKCIVTLDSHGSPSFRVLGDVAYDAIPVPEEAMQSLAAERYDALYFGTLQQRGEVSRASLQKILNRLSFREIFCDMNLREGCYDEESVHTVLNNATILKLSDEEKPLLNAFPFWASSYAGEDFAAALFRDYPQLHTVLYTKGADGSDIFVRASRTAAGTDVFARDPRTVSAEPLQSPEAMERFSIPPVPVKAVSAVGAGDSYGAAYLAAYLSGKSPRQAGAVAAAVSAFVVSVREAVPDYRADRFMDN